MKSNLIQSNGPISVSRYKNAMMLSTEDPDGENLDDQLFASAQESAVKSEAADGLVLALQDQE